jgi:hypothetical protein
VKFCDKKKNQRFKFLPWKCAVQACALFYNGLCSENSLTVIMILEQTVYLTFWHRSFTFNSNKSPTWCNNFSVYYPDVCLQLDMFRAFSRPSSGAQWLQWQPLVLPLYHGDSCAVFVVRPARPRTQHDCHHDTKVKPEAATAVTELLMMGGKTPETCRAAG